MDYLLIDSITSNLPVKGSSSAPVSSLSKRIVLRE